MKRSALSLLLIFAAVATAQDEVKDRVEAPIKKPIADVGKMVVEAPIKDAMKGLDATKLKSAYTPGKVKWHASFDKAVEAAKKSGKPIMLFQLLGNLDEEFC